MKRLSPRSKLIVGVAVAALAGGGAAAVLATRGDESGGGREGRQAAREDTQATHTDRSGRARGDLAVAAGYLGVPRARVREELRSGRPLAKIAEGSPGKSSSGLINALVNARAAQLAAAVADGKLNRSQERKRLATLRKRVAAKVNAAQHPTSAAPGDLSVAARYIGLSDAQLRHDLRAGRTLAQIAGATPGRSAGGLINALVASRRSRLAAAVAGGAISTKQQKALLASLEKRVTKRVNRLPPHRA